jgi:hypothetical protein
MPANAYTAINTMVAVRIMVALADVSRKYDAYIPHQQSPPQ